MKSVEHGEPDGGFRLRLTNLLDTQKHMGTRCQLAGCKR
jgi:hypothetical protein